MDASVVTGRCGQVAASGYLSFHLKRGGSERKNPWKFSSLQRTCVHSNKDFNTKDSFLLFHLYARLYPGIIPAVFGVHGRPVYMSLSYILVLCPLANPRQFPAWNHQYIKTLLSELFRFQCHSDSHPCQASKSQIFAWRIEKLINVRLIHFGLFSLFFLF